MTIQSNRWRKTQIMPTNPAAAVRRFGVAGSSHDGSSPRIGALGFRRGGFISPRTARAIKRNGQVREQRPASLEEWLAAACDQRHQHFGQRRIRALNQPVPPIASGPSASSALNTHDSPSLTEQSSKLRRPRQSG